MTDDLAASEARAEVVASGDVQLEQHRSAYRAVMAVLPDSEWISHKDQENPNWERPEVYMVVPVSGPLAGCKDCGDSQAGMGLIERCRDWHDICPCGAPYDGGAPKNPGCLRRIRKVDGKSIPIHPKPWKGSS